MQIEPFDFTRAPFCLRADAEPQQAAREIVASFMAVSKLRDRATRSFRAVMEVTGVGRMEPLRRAGEAIALDIDEGGGDGSGNAYHNSQHFCEVLLGAHYLSLLAALAPEERTRLLVAALAHDLHHDGKGMPDIPFRLERISVDAAVSCMATAGVAKAEQAHIAVLILATQFSEAVPYARQCHRYFLGKASRPKVPGNEPRLALLADDARLAFLAVLLAEADVLPSVGLTVEYGELNQSRLSMEWGRALSAADKLDFLERGFGDFIANRFFAPNLERLRQAMHVKA